MPIVHTETFCFPQFQYVLLDVELNGFTIT